LIALPYSSSTFELTRLVDRASAPLELDGTSARLFVRQIIDVVDGHCQVESYSYRLQTDESVESWLIRWEYYRAAPRPDYPYPLAHAHVNAAFANGSTVGRPGELRLGTPPIAPLHGNARRSVASMHRLGHEDTRTTINEYGQQLPSVDAGVADGLAGLFNGAVEPENVASLPQRQTVTK
jgi:hypothetical protein